MKNIHLLPTDKPSRLAIVDGTWLGTYPHGSSWFPTEGFVNQNIYITSDEKPKDGEWALYDKKYIRKVDNTFNQPGMDWNVLNTDKIVLTTDDELIADGVQAIDDEFLQWYVKNPDCESVETYKVKLCTNCGQQYCDNLQCAGYPDKPIYLVSVPENTTKRIITYCDGYEVKGERIDTPQEESKQPENVVLGDKTSIVPENLGLNMIDIVEESKQETVEEFAERMSSVIPEVDSYSRKGCKNAIIVGANWQAERMYSDMIDFASWVLIQDITSRGEGDYVNSHGKIVTVKDLFEQFKKQKRC